MRVSGNSIPMLYLADDKEKMDGVELERWGWAVLYKDGSELLQFDVQNGIFHRLGEIKQDEIKYAFFYNLDNIQKRIVIPWVDGMRIVHRYRNILLGETGELIAYRIYVFGWKLGQTHTFFFILPDDQIIASPTDTINLSQYL